MRLEEVQQLRAKPSQLARAARILHSLRLKDEALLGAGVRPSRAGGRRIGDAATDLSSRFAVALLLMWEGRRSDSGRDRAQHVAQALGACSVALGYGASENEAIAALLHGAGDAEGQEPMLKRVREILGPRVVELLDALQDPFADADLPDHLHYRLYLDHVAISSASARFVLVAHKLHAARAFLSDVRRNPADAWAGLEHGYGAVMSFAANLVGVFEHRDLSPMLAEFQDVMDELHFLAVRDGVAAAIEDASGDADAYP